MNRIKILHVIRPADGGMKNHLLDIVSHIDKTRYQVEVACPIGSSVEIELKKMKVKTFPISLKGNLSPILDLRAIWQLARQLKRTKATVIHNHGTKAALVGRLAASIAKTPVVIYTVHNSIFYDHLSENQKRLLGLMEKTLARKTDRIITVSNALMEEILLMERIDKGKITTIYNGINIDKISIDTNKLKVRKSLMVPPLGKLVGVVARLAPQKGVGYFLKAASLLKDQHVNFVVIGDGPLKDQLVNEVISLGLENRVFFTGYREDIGKVLPVLDILVLPSITEGLPLIILEAMAAGCPIIATKVGGVPEVITNGVNGILVEAKNPYQIATAVKDLLLNENKAKKMGQVARELVTQKYSLQYMLERTMEVYQQVITEKSKNK